MDSASGQIYSKLEKLHQILRTNNINSTIELTTTAPQRYIKPEAIESMKDESREGKPNKNNLTSLSEDTTEGEVEVEGGGYQQHLLVPLIASFTLRVFVSLRDGEYVITTSEGL